MMKRQRVDQRHSRQYQREIFANVSRGRLGVLVTITKLNNKFLIFARFGAIVIFASKIIILGFNFLKFFKFLSIIYFPQSNLLVPDV